MKKILLKILEPIVLAGMVVFLGFVFLIELIAVSYKHLRAHETVLDLV